MGIVILTQIRFWLLCSTTATTSSSLVFPLVDGSCNSRRWWGGPCRSKWRIMCVLGRVLPVNPPQRGRRWWCCYYNHQPLVVSHCVLFDKLHPHGLILLLLHTSLYTGDTIMSLWPSPLLCCSGDRRPPLVKHGFTRVLSVFKWLLHVYLPPRDGTGSISTPPPSTRLNPFPVVGGAATEG